MPNEPYGYVVEIRRTHNWTYQDASQGYGYEEAPEPWTYFVTAGCGELTMFDSADSAARAGFTEDRSPGAMYRVMPVFLGEATAWTPTE